MYLDETQLKKYTCKFEKKFIADFIEVYRDNIPYDQALYNSNDLLEFLYSYPEITDKSKQYFFYMCMKTFGDVPKPLIKKYTTKFGLINCGEEIYNSFACVNSNIMINCNGLTSSFGCSKCKFSHHLLYCNDQKHKSYMAFNKQITKQRFSELIKLSPEELEKEPEFDRQTYEKTNSLIEYMYRLKDNA